MRRRILLLTVALGAATPIAAQECTRMPEESTVALGMTLSSGEWRTPDYHWRGGEITLRKDLGEGSPAAEVITVVAGLGHVEEEGGDAEAEEVRFGIAGSKLLWRSPIRFTSLCLNSGAFSSATPHGRGLERWEFAVPVTLMAQVELGMNSPAVVVFAEGGMKLTHEELSLFHAQPEGDGELLQSLNKVTFEPVGSVGMRIAGRAADLSVEYLHRSPRNADRSTVRIAVHVPIH